MGWTSCENIYDESYTMQEIIDEVQECMEMEVDSVPPEHLPWEEYEDIVDSEEEAKKIIEEHFTPREKNVIVRYMVWEESKKYSILSKRLEDTKESLNALIKSKAPQYFKAAYVSCPTCGSKINRTYFVDHNHCCLVCGGEMWAESTSNRYSGYIDKIRKTEEELSKCKRKGKVMRLVKGYLYLG